MPNAAHLSNGTRLHGCARSVKGVLIAVIVECKAHKYEMKCFQPMEKAIRVCRRRKIYFVFVHQKNGICELLQDSQRHGTHFDACDFPQEPHARNAHIAVWQIAIVIVHGGS